MADLDGWYRFTQVINFVPSGHKLYRASAPNYKTTVTDSDQDLTQAAVNFLVSQGIDSIDSFKEYVYTTAEKERLAKVPPAIKYLHIKLGDFKPPTLAQFAQVNAFFLSNKSTLVHCGYGWGRTGTGITALQIFTENGKTLQPLASSWITPLAHGRNNVETREQVSALSEQRNLLFPCVQPVIGTKPVLIYFRFSLCLRSRVTGIPTGDPQQAFAIINFATGYYLTLSTDKAKIVSRSPETAEKTTTIQRVVGDPEYRVSPTRAYRHVTSTNGWSRRTIRDTIHSLTRWHPPPLCLPNPKVLSMIS